MARKGSYGGVSRLRRAMRRFPEEIRADLRKTFEVSARELQQEIQTRAPVDEGRLRDAAFYQVSRDGLSAVIGYSKNRTGFKRRWKKGGFTALWAEFGTKHSRKTPFISPAFRAKLSGILDRIERSVADTISRAQNFGK